MKCWKSFILTLIKQKNGIFIDKDPHVLYHNAFGYKNNTLEQFKTFLVLLLKSQVKPTSSQGDNCLSDSSLLNFYQELSQGSETRVLDSKRILRLHECLGELGYEIFKELIE